MKRLAVFLFFALQACGSNPAFASDNIPAVQSLSIAAIPDHLECYVWGKDCDDKTNVCVSVCHDKPDPSYPPIDITKELSELEAEVHELQVQVQVKELSFRGARFQGATITPAPGYYDK